ncbi:MAG TPA: hypothetical protein PK760_09335, partial [Flavobacteriales bacterium]|nr:hypothetical protein [Flavobacteriales bacterium]
MLRRTLSLLLLLNCVLLNAQHALRFIENKGQWPEQVTHRAEWENATLWFEHGALMIDRYDGEAMAATHANVNAILPIEVKHHSVRLKFLNTAAVKVESARQLSGHYSYFLGNDRKTWASKARPFAQVIMRDVAPGCDAVFSEGRAGLKYDLVLAPHADPKAITFTYEGASELRLSNGALIVGTSLGRMIERIPIAYQEVGDERRIIECRYTLKNGVVGVQPSAYDTSLPLVIDPTLSFATYSGSFSNNFGYTTT